MISRIQKFILFIFVIYMISFLRNILFFCVMMSSFFLNSLAFAWDFGFGVGPDHQNIKATKEVAVPGVQKDQDEVDILSVIKSAVNRVLGILGLIALALLLYGWFSMLLSAGNDEKYQTWWKFVKSVLYGLLIIWLSWLIISLIFWLIQVTTKDALPVDA